MADIKINDDFKKLAETMDVHNFTISDRYIMAEMVPDMLAGLLHPDDEIRQKVAAEQLHAELTRQVATGEIQLHDPDSKLPIRTANLGADMIHTDIEKFAALCGLTVEWKKKKGSPMQWDMKEFTEELAMEWLKKPCWSIAEAVFLLGEVQIPVSRRAGYPLPPEFAGNAGGGLDSLIRAIVTRQLKPIANVDGSILGRFPLYSPADMISVAESIDFGNWNNWKMRLGRVLTTQTQTDTSWPDEIRNEPRITFRFPQPDASPKQAKTQDDGINQELQTDADLAAAATITSRFIESVIVDMEKGNEKITVSTIWPKLLTLSGKSIIEDTKPYALLCNVGEDDLYHLKKGAVKGVLQRRRARQRHA